MRLQGQGAEPNLGFVACMVGASFAASMVAVVCAAGVSATAPAQKPAASVTMSKHVLDLSVYPDAVCLDGTPGAFYVAEASSDSAKNNWLVFLEGGGWCFSPADCVLRSDMVLGSSATYPDTMHGRALQGLASLNCTTSPGLCEYNHVYVKYCDATSYSGQLPGSFKYNCFGMCDERELYFKGRYLLDAIFETLLSVYSMDAAESVLYTGCSAGGAGVILSADFVHAKLKFRAPKLQKFAAVPSSGLFMDADSVQAGANFANAWLQLANMARMATAAPGAARRSRCEQEYGDLQSWKCTLPRVAYGYVEAPIFLMNSALDWWQTDFILARQYLAGIGPSGGPHVPGWESCSTNVTACSAEQLPLMNAFADGFQAAVRAADTFEKAGNGAFVDVCHWHCEAVVSDEQGDPWGTFEVGGVKQREALLAWWGSDLRAPAGDYTSMELCRYGVAAQCNPTCTIFSSPFGTAQDEAHQEFI